MRFSAYEDGTGDEHDDAPQLVVAEADVERAVDQLIEDEACPGTCQSEPDDSVVVAFPGHGVASPRLLRRLAPRNDEGGGVSNEVAGRAGDDIVISSP